MVFYCERAAGFCNNLGNQDEGTSTHSTAPNRDVLIGRLDRVRLISHNFGYGVGDDMDSLLARYSAT